MILQRYLLKLIIEKLVLVGLVGTSVVTDKASSAIVELFLLSIILYKRSKPCDVKGFGTNKFLGFQILNSIIPCFFYRSEDNR